MLKYLKKLDSDKKLQKAALQYDKADITDLFDLTKARLKKAKIKRINIQVPFELYLEALKIGGISGTGYQNAMKMAMFLGFKAIENTPAKRH